MQKSAEFPAVPLLAFSQDGIVWVQIADGQMPISYTNDKVLDQVARLSNVASLLSRHFFHDHGASGVAVDAFLRDFAQYFFDNAVSNWLVGCQVSIRRGVNRCLLYTSPSPRDS